MFGLRGDAVRIGWARLDRSAQLPASWWTRAWTVSGFEQITELHIDTLADVL